MDLLITCGIWTKAEYLRLLEDARVASPDFPQALEFLVNKADPSWLSERGG
jgi:non-ribosomal peptide synthetase component F